MKLNLTECFYRKADTQPNKPLIIGPGKNDNISYGEFKEKIILVAKELKELGVKAGDNIGLHYPNGADYIAYTYAVWHCGAYVTPIPVELAVEEKVQIFQHIHLNHVLSSIRLIKNIESCCKKNIRLNLGKQAVLFAPITQTVKPPPGLENINVAFIRFTSGTTGNAKGVVLSHETIYERIHAANHGLQIDSNDRILWLLSMAYHFAVSIVAYLTFGASIILVSNNFGITLLRAAQSYKSTFIYGAPTHYNLMLNDNSGQTLPSELRFAIVTTTGLRPEIADDFYTRFGHVLNETYGIIEIGLPAINLSNLRIKQGSVGIPLPDYKIKLSASEISDQSEIMISGKGIIDAYYSPWQSRKDILAQNNGYFKTGDLGEIDTDGFLYIVGRSKEIISVAGMKFFPQEVETVLEKHPLIATACVFAYKDHHAGELPYAQIVLTEKQNDIDIIKLNLFCQQYLAQYKIPKQYHIVTQLTYTSSGKLIRNANKLIKES